MRPCDATVEVLREHNEPSTMCGDEWLIQQAALTAQGVLVALTHTLSPLVKSPVRMLNDCCVHGQAALCFELPDQSK